MGPKATWAEAVLQKKEDWAFPLFPHPYPRHGPGQGQWHGNSPASMPARHPVEAWQAASLLPACCGDRRQPPSLPPSSRRAFQRAWTGAGQTPAACPFTSYKTRSLVLFYQGVLYCWAGVGETCLYCHASELCWATGRLIMDV